MKADLQAAAPAAALLAAALLAAACGGGDGDGDGVAASPRAEPGSPGHARMLEELARVRDEATRENPFLGRAPIPQLEADLAALPEDVPDLQRWLFHDLLGKHLLRVGEIERAVEHRQRALEEWKIWRREIPPAEALRTRYDLGVAWMRLGETQNCALRHTSESCIVPFSPDAQHVLREGSENAMRHFGEVLEAVPLESFPGLKARWLYNVAAMTLGRYPHGVPEAWRIDPAVFEPDVAFPRFRNVAPQLGLHAFDLAGGAAAEDFDGDGDLDLITSTSDTAGGMHYFRNEGDGTWTERTTEAGLDGLLGGLNLNHADYDNDGDADVFVLRGGWWHDLGRHPNSLLENDGAGRFVDVTFEAGLGEVHYPTQTAAWADYDLDGDLDLYVGNEHSRRQRAPSQLFRNEGDGTFVDVAAAAGVENLRYAKAVSWGDIDEDGDPDLFVANLPEANRLYRNEGDGTFVDVAEEAGVRRPASAFPSWFFDADDDGALDLYVASYGGPNLPADVGWVAASYLGVPTRAEAPRLYKGDGTGRFRDVAEAAGVDDVALPMGSNFGDLDNDGRLDFYLGTGYPYYDGVMPNRMYRNRGGMRFEEITWNGGFGHLQKGHAVVFADLDADGDQDVYEQMGGAYPGDRYSNALYLNPGFDRSWIKLRLVGTRSNRAAFGARLALTFDDGGERRTVHRTVGTGGSFGANPALQEIGLGAADRVERLAIRWPSGLRQEFSDLPVRRLLRIVEGEDAPRISEPRPIPMAAAADALPRNRSETLDPAAGDA